MTNAFVLDSPADDIAEIPRSHRTSSFSKTDPPGPRLLRGRPLGTQLLVRKIKFKDTGHIITPENSHRDTGEADVSRLARSLNT